MRVKFLSTQILQKAAGDVVYGEGEIHDLGRDAAMRWIRRGVVEIVADDVAETTPPEGVFAPGQGAGPLDVPPTPPASGPAASVPAASGPAPSGPAPSGQIGAAVPPPSSPPAAPPQPRTSTRSGTARSRRSPST